MGDAEIKLTAQKSKELTADQIAQIDALFDQTYEAANFDYLHASFDVLRWTSLAFDGDTLAGFTLGDGVTGKVPRVAGEQKIALAGIGCIDADYRRQGLFQRLAMESMMASGEVSFAGSTLFCGRMAHAITYRTAKNTAAGVVPSAGLLVSDWHSEVLQYIAGLYKVKVDPASGVVQGKGEPIGYPRLSYGASDSEKELFAHVNRDKGDSLLTVGWMPEAPPDW